MVRGEDEEEEEREDGPFMRVFLDQRGGGGLKEERNKFWIKRSKW